jgi:hypothetical protein
MHTSQPRVHNFSWRSHQMSIASDVEMSPLLTLQQLEGWNRLLEAPARTPFSFRGDNLKNAIDEWATNGELSTVKKIKNDDQYPIALELKMQLLLFSSLQGLCDMEGISMQQKIASDPDLAGTGATPQEVISNFAQLVSRKSNVSLPTVGPNIVVYTAPRFCSELKIDEISGLANSSVINPKIPAPQYGFGAKYSYDDLRRMSDGFSARLITIEFDRKVHGFYFLHLDFPSEPVVSAAESKQRAYDLGLLKGETLLKTQTPRKRHFGELDFHYEFKSAWADLVAISADARKYFSSRGEHAYSLVHSSMVEMAQIYGVQRIFGEVRIGPNQNLAWEAHQKLGWTMPDEAGQRKDPIMHGDNQYALIYLDLF